MDDVIELPKVKTAKRTKVGTEFLKQFQDDYVLYCISNSCSDKQYFLIDYIDSKVGDFARLGSKGIFTKNKNEALRFTEARADDTLNLLRISGATYEYGKEKV